MTSSCAPEGDGYATEAVAGGRAQHRVQHVYLGDECDCAKVLSGVQLGPRPRAQREVAFSVRRSAVVDFLLSLYFDFRWETFGFSGFEV